MKKLCNIFLCGLLFVLPACEKDTSASIFAPEVSTGTASNIYRKGATVSGSIRFAEGMSAERYGILFSGYQSMSQPQELEVSDGSIDFSFQLQGLEMGKTYYFCTYASGGYSTVRGEVRSFTTTDSNAPIFSAPTVIETTHKSVVISSTLLDDGGSEVMLSGFCFNEVGENLPNFIDHVSNVQLSGHTITATITSLAPLKNYQIRAYGASVKGVAYSETVTFGTEKAVVPFLADIVCHSTTWHSLDIESSVLESGSGEVTETGFCFSTTNQCPTLDDQVVSIEADGTSFFTLLDELSPGTTYYVCAYAKNEYGIGYSEVFTYTPEQPELAYLIDGVTFNERIKQLANETVSSRGVYDIDNLIAKIEFTTEVHTLPEKYVTISADNSPAPVYASFNPTDSLLTVFTSAKDMEIVNASHMFYGLASLRTIDWGDFNINETTVNTSSMFTGCTALTTLNLTSWKPDNVTNMSYMFESCTSLKTLDLSHWNVQNVTEITQMFDYCHSLVSLNVAHWDLSKITNMSGVFGYCSSLITLDMSDWTLDDNIILGSMFAFCASHTKACEITCSQTVQNFLLNHTAITSMEPSWFIWVNGKIENDGSSVENMPNIKW